MFCEGSEGDGAGDCTCAFAMGTAAARMAAVKICAQSRIMFSPILRASLLVPVRGGIRDKQYLARGFPPKRTIRHVVRECRNSGPNIWNFAHLRAYQSTRGRRL